jgi:hypothetical protein
LKQKGKKVTPHLTAVHCSKHLGRLTLTASTAFISIARASSAVLANAGEPMRNTRKLVMALSLFLGRDLETADVTFKCTLQDIASDSSFKNTLVLIPCDIGSE